MAVTLWHDKMREYSKTWRAGFSPKNSIKLFFSWRGLIGLKNALDFIRNQKARNNE